MTYIITRLCRDCVHRVCVALCGVVRICVYVGEERELFPNQLYIHPDECIDCGACEPECPWQAIFEEVAVPKVFRDDIALNYLMKDQVAEFKVPPYAKKPHPTADEIAANKQKWGWTG